MLRPYPAVRAEPLQPPAEYARWRTEGPVTSIVLPSGLPAWLVTRYEDVRQLLRDPRLSSDSTRDGYPRFGAAVETEPLNRTFIGLDGAAHARLRRMLAAEFSAAAVRRMRPAIDAIADECADRMGRGPRPADLVGAYALPVASRVICHVLGVPYDLHDEFEHLTEVLTDGRQGAAEKRRAAVAVTTMLRDLARDRAADPRDDLVSRLMVGHVATGDLTEREAVDNLALLLGAGHDTSASMLGLGALSLLGDERERHRLATGGVLDRAAVDELLRFHSIIQLGVARVATADIAVGGQVIRAGEGVVLSLPAANHDPDRFAGPDALDLRRGNAHQHLAFGSGAHHCIGHLVARETLASALPRLLRRLPGLRPAVPVDELHFKESMDFHGIRTFPVSW
ncbi:cytochrome P450 [Micromonospora sp. NPDC092111]|uniref:cytochrome P450 n=1 Tax=Micromonospora sp. NPDC092111 TaxID=3364289 RepID=UPI0037F4A3ED